MKKLKINKRDFSFLETVGRIDVRWSLFMWEFVFYDFFDKGSAFWKAVICEKGKHSELAKAVSPSRKLPPSKRQNLYQKNHKKQIPT